MWHRSLVLKTKGLKKRKFSRGKTGSHFLHKIFIFSTYFNCRNSPFVTKGTCFSGGLTCSKKIMFSGYDKVPNYPATQFLSFWRSFIILLYHGNITPNFKCGILIVSKNSPGGTTQWFHFFSNLFRILTAIVILVVIKLWSKTGNLGEMLAPPTRPPAWR